MKQELSAQDAIRTGHPIPRYVYDIHSRPKNDFNTLILEMQDDGWDVFQFIARDGNYRFVDIVFRKKVN
jgi:hypothetical protein